MYEDVIKRYRPRGWRVRYSKRKDVIAAESFAYWSLKNPPAASSSMKTVAIADPVKRVIYAPHVVDPFTLHTLLHEFGHVHLKHWSDGESVCHREEYEAERWAAEIVRMEGIKVPRASLRAMRQYIKACIAKDEANGIEIQPHVRRFADGRKHRP